jgi:hypothetical protein
MERLCVGVVCRRIPWTPSQSLTHTLLQVAGVQYVIDTVIYALLANPDRKFAYAEMVEYLRHAFSHRPTMKPRLLLTRRGGGGGRQRRGDEELVKI